MSKVLIIFILVSGLTIESSQAQLGSYSHKELTHQHREPSKNEDHKDDDDHKSNTHKHDHHEDQHQEVSEDVGPNKGILSATVEDGISLASEAIKNFGIETKKIQGEGPWELPIKAKLASGEEVNIYRYRDGFFKRIDFEQVGSDSLKFKVKTKELRQGDEVVIEGVGYLRIAEITAFGGNSGGHAH